MRTHINNMYNKKPNTHNMASAGCRVAQILLIYGLHIFCTWRRDNNGLRFPEAFCAGILEQIGNASMYFMYSMYCTYLKHTSFEMNYLDTENAKEGGA